MQFGASALRMKNIRKLCRHTKVMDEMVCFIEFEAVMLAVIGFHTCICFLNGHIESEGYDKFFSKKRTWTPEEIALYVLQTD